MTDPLGRITSYAYDNLGQVTAVTLPDPDGAGSLTSPLYQFAYDAVGNLTAETNPLGNVTSYEYDSADRLWKVIEADPDGAGPLAAPLTTYSYNVLDYLTSVTDPSSVTTSWTYDRLDRVTQESNSVGANMFYAYDSAGNRTWQKDALGNRTSYTYDEHNRVQSEINARGDATTFTYDAVGNLLTLTDQELNTTTWTYDDLDRMIEEENELGDSRFFEYDSIGNLIQKTDRNGRVTEYVHDNLYRNKQELWKSGGSTVHTIDWTYDVASQLTEAADSFAEYDYTYDGLGRATGIVADIAGLTPVVTLAQQFNANGRRTQLSATIGSTADFKNDYAYDNLSRLTQITQQDVSGGNTVADKRVDFTYKADGQFDQIKRYANLTGTQLVAQSNYGYDGAGRLTSLSHTKGGTTFAGYGWTYDAANRKTNFTNSAHSAENATYTYDSTDQLTGVDRTGSSNDESYAYDDNGNRETANGSTYSTGDNNRLLSDGVYNYEYDAEGNRTKRIELVGGNPTGATTEYSYDHRNRQTSVVEKDSPTGTVIKQADYTYDAFNRRIAKTIDADGAGVGAAVTTFLIHDGQDIVLSLEDDGAVAHRYLYGNAVDQLFADESASGDLLWGLTDDQNTPRDIVEYDAGTNTTTVVNHIFFDGFGNIASETNAAIDYLLGVQGMERDEETGTYHADNREYDPLVGLWTQEDKIGFHAGSAKLDAFVGNDPANRIDPSGLVETRAAAEGRVLGAAIEEHLVQLKEGKRQRGVPNQPNKKLKEGIVDIAVGGTRTTQAEIGRGTIPCAKNKVRQANSRLDKTNVILAEATGEIPVAGDTRKFVELSADDVKGLVKRARESLWTDAQFFEEASKKGSVQSVTVSETAANHGAKTRARIAGGVKILTGIPDAIGFVETIRDAADAVNGNTCHVTYYFDDEGGKYYYRGNGGYLGGITDGVDKVYVSGKREGEADKGSYIWARLHVLWKSIFDRPTIDRRDTANPNWLEAYGA